MYPSPHLLNRTPSANGVAEPIVRGITCSLIEEAAVGPGVDVGASGITPATGGIVKVRPHDEVGLPITVDVPSPGNGEAERIARSIAGPLVEEAATGSREDVGAPGTVPTTNGIVKTRPHDEIGLPISVHVPSPGNGVAEEIDRGIAAYLIEEATVGPGEDVGAPGIIPTAGGIVLVRSHDEVGPPIPTHVPSPGNGNAEAIAPGIAAHLVEEAAVGPGEH